MTISLKIQTIEQTGWACPSSWEGQMDDGRFVYIRYRWGTLTVNFGATIDEACSMPFRKDWFYGEVGGAYSGEIELDEVCDLTGLIPPDQAN